MARPMPKAITLTDAAAERMRHIMAASGGKYIGVRIGVKNGGCAGMSYTMDLAQTVEKGDEVVETQGVRVLIDPKAVLFLLGTTMDFTVDKMSAKFVFRNPNETSACGCGESVSITPAKPETVN